MLRASSDHLPIRLDLDLDGQPLGFGGRGTCLHFEVMWTRENACEEVIRSIGIRWLLVVLGIVGLVRLSLIPPDWLTRVDLVLGIFVFRNNRLFYDLTF